jgi:DNA invertase Pin-like site-specific DNA recombinase
LKAQDRTLDSRPVFGYVRVSTNRQETERQQHTIPERHKGLPDGLDSNELELFYDHGFSGYSGKPRPDFEKMLARINTGEASALIVDTSSRLTRQGIRAALDILWQLQDAGCRLFTTQGREYTPNLGGIVSLVADAEADNNYSSTLGHNIHTGKEAKAREGRWHHGDAPPGYQFSKETKELDATGDLPLIAEAFRLFVDEQATYKRICDYLTATLSPESIVRRKNSRTYVSRDRLRGLLSNPLYAGYVPHLTRNIKELAKGTHTPAVSLDTFEKAQQRLSRHIAENVRPPRSWPFSGIAKCGTCGHAVRIHPVTNKTRTYHYVRCGGEDCPKRTHLPIAASFEANVVTGLVSIAVALQDVIASDPSFGVPSGSGPTPEQAKEHVEECQAKVKKLARLIADDALDADDPSYLRAVRERDEAKRSLERLSRGAKSYRDELDALAGRILGLADHVDEDERQWIEHETVTVRDAATGRELLPERREALAILGWEAADFETRRDVIAQTLEAVYVSDDSAEFHFHTGLPVTLTTAPHFASKRGVELRALESQGWGQPSAEGFGESRVGSSRVLATRG